MSFKINDRGLTREIATAAEVTDGQPSMKRMLSDGRTSGQQPQIATIIAVSPQPNRISANKNDPSMDTSIAILILERNDGNVQRQCV